MRGLRLPLFFFDLRLLEILAEGLKLGQIARPSIEEGEDDERGHLSAVCGGRGGFIGPKPDAGDLQPIRAGHAGSRRLLRNPVRSLSTMSMYELKPIKGCYVEHEILFAREKLTLVSDSPISRTCRSI